MVTDKLSTSQSYTVSIYEIMCVPLISLSTDHNQGNVYGTKSKTLKMMLEMMGYCKVCAWLLTKG